MSHGFDAWFGATPAMVILRGLDAADALALADRAWALGITLVEVPVQSERDVATLAHLVEHARDVEGIVGAGTVTSVELVRRSADAGAAFTVAPGLDAEVMRASLDRGLPHLPGVATPTEIHQALRLGLRWLKAFPAAQLGPAWVRAVRAPFPDVRLVATGGVDPANAVEFLRAGAGAVSFGTSFAAASDAELAAALHR